MESLVLPGALEPRRTHREGAFEDPGGFFLASLVSAAIFLIGLRLVFLSEDKVIEKIY